VIDIELEDIKSKVGRFYQRYSPEKAPKIGFIVVNKRTNTRLFEKSNARYRAEGYTNPLPGTVADDVVTFKER
jgi:Piwi domain